MFILTYAAALLATVFLVVAVAFSFRRRLVDICLSCYLISAAVWIGGNAIADVAYTNYLLIATSDWAFFGAYVNFLCVFILVDVILDQKFPSLKRLLWYAIPCLAIGCAGFTRYGVIGTLFPPGEPAEIIPGPIYQVGLYFSFIVFGYVLWRLVRALRGEQDENRRMQFLYVFVSMLVVAVSETVFDVLLPLFGQYQLYDLGPITTFVFALGCGYAIMKHKLLDIRVAIQRGLLYALLVGTIVITYLGLTVLFGFILKASTNTDIFTSGAITILMGICGTPIIERYFRKVSDPIFFKERLNYADSMHRLSMIAQMTVDFDELILKMEQALSEIVRATYVRILLDEGEDARTDIGVNKKEHLLVPIRFENEHVGTILIGEKLSGDVYSDTDKRFVDTFSNQAATALSRVRLYKEVESYAEKLEEKVAERTEALHALQKEQQNMLLELSHNLQTPLAIFQTKIDRMHSFFPSDDEARGMERAIASLSDFIYDLLAISSLESILREEDHEILSLSSLLEEIVDEIEIITSDSGISVRRSIESTLVYGNAKRLREAIINLANNAVKYMADGRQKEISFTLSLDTLSSTLTITDTGRGIASLDLPHIFERFYRAEGSKTHIEGTGLGLSIVKQIMERHGGSVTAASTLDAGSVFTLIFPSVSANALHQ